MGHFAAFSLPTLPLLWHFVWGTATWVKCLDECSGIQYQIISLLFIVLGVNTFIYHKHSWSIHTSYSSLTDASVNPDLTLSLIDYKDFEKHFVKTENKINTFLSIVFFCVPCWVTMLNSAFPKKKRTEAAFPNCLTSKSQKHCS